MFIITKLNIDSQETETISKHNNKDEAIVFLDNHIKEPNELRKILDNTYYEYEVTFPWYNLKSWISYPTKTLKYKYQIHEMKDDMNMNINEIKPHPFKKKN